MKKNLITLIVLVALAFGIYFVSGLVSVKPPSPTITVGEKKVEVAQGSYCWDRLLNSGCVDMISPPEIIKHHELTPAAVSPESELKIEFKSEPKENTLGVNIWHSNEETENVPLNGNAFIVPKENGIYVYDVHANWEKGSSNYAFAIEVK